MLRSPLRVGILITPQFTFNALANFVDVLRLASDHGDASGAIDCHYDLMSATGNTQRASCGYALAPTRNLIEPSKLDYIALVGGLLYRGRSLDRETSAYLREAAAERISLIGICTGTFVLCRLGLMRERRVCVSWFHEADFAVEFPQLESVTDALYVIDRDRVTTSGGIGAALAAAALVERHVGEQVAQKALDIMHVPRLANQQHTSADTPNCAGTLVRRALRMMETHISDALTIDDIAAGLNVSRRTLEREFERDLHESPKQRYLNLRLSHAHLLRQAGYSLCQVAVETGFSRTSYLCRAYRRKFGRRDLRAKP